MISIPWRQQMGLMLVLVSVEGQEVSRAGMTRTAMNRIANALTEAVPEANVEAQAVPVVPAVNVEVPVVFLDLANRHRHQIRSILGR